MSVRKGRRSNVICSAKPLRSYLLADFIKLVPENGNHRSCEVNVIVPPENDLFDLYQCFNFHFCLILVQGVCNRGFKPDYFIGDEALLA